MKVHQGGTTIESVLRRDRLIVSIGLTAISTVAWVYILDLALGMSGTATTGVHMSGTNMVMAVAEPNTMSWSLSELLLTFIMWTVMMVAMMTPSVAPTVLQFSWIYRKRHNQDSLLLATTLFLSGYFLVWTLFSGLATVAQWRLHTAALLSPGMAVTSRVLGGMLLVMAGVFQWTGLKHRCLRSCRSPIGFFLNEWREGRSGIFAMGIKHGRYCLECCFLLMAILFLAGVMNLLWVATIAALVLIEKLSKAGPAIARVAGAAMLVWGGWMIVTGF
jgi:predicted metal-binding membrane protein